MDRLIRGMLLVAGFGLLVQVSTIVAKISNGRADPAYDSWIIVGGLFILFALCSISWKLRQKIDQATPSKPRHLTITPSRNT